MRLRIWQVLTNPERDLRLPRLRLLQDELEQADVQPVISILCYSAEG